MIVGRMVTRLVCGSDGLCIVGLNNSGRSLFDSNTVYEMSMEVNGSIRFKPIGESNVAKSGETIDSSPIGVHWVQDVSVILDNAGSGIFSVRDGQ